jgi:uncharacterized zinc-type alcohol dehydrogenase-like protein
MVVGVGIPD